MNNLVELSFPVVAVVGMCGSGKSVLSQMFIDNGWEYVYFGNVTMEELKKRNLEKNEVNERMIREELREKYGIDAYAKLLMPRIMEFSSKKPTVLDGLYSWSEYKLLKNELKDRLIILAIVTNSGLRYERLISRKNRPLDKNSAVNRDFAEIENLEKGGPIAIADYYIMNNDGIELLKESFKEFLKTLNL